MNKNASIKVSPVSVVLLDTNVLHYLDLYTKSAKEHNWYPFGKERIVFGSDTDKKLRDAYNWGEAVMRYIQTGSIQVQYSPVSELELLEGRLKGRALLRAADQGIPDRMWSKYSESEIRERLVLDDFRDVHNGIRDLLEILEGLDIDAMVSHEERMNEVWSIARGLAKIVFLTPADCLIYATALVVEAKYLVTADHYLWRTAKQIAGSQLRGTGAQVLQLLTHVSPVVPSVDMALTLPLPKKPRELRELVT